MRRRHPHSQHIGSPSMRAVRHHRSAVVAMDDRLSLVRHVVLAAVIWIVLTVGSLAIVLRVVLALPVDYFERERVAHPSWTLRRLAKNVAGRRRPSARGEGPP